MQIKSKVKWFLLGWLELDDEILDADSVQSAHRAHDAIEDWTTTKSSSLISRLFFRFGVISFLLFRLQTLSVD